jgi:hypothetical protein
VRSTESTTGPRRALARVTGAAVAAATLAGSLLATASPAGATQMLGTACPVVWNGTELATASLSAQYQLYVYEQVPGAPSWTQHQIANTSPDGDEFATVSITATSSSVQIVALDTAGNIWFYQQADGQSTWSAAQLVGNMSTDNVEGWQTPRIAWTGVPGHTGTNSVIAVADGSGNILMWYQNGGGWTQETVSGAPSGGYEYYDATLTATDQGIDVVALDNDGDFFSFFQAYGPNPWTSTGVAAPPNQSFNSVAVTWDGGNVDVAAVYNDGSPYPYGADELMFLWKPDSASTWNQEDILGTKPTQPFDYIAGITYTGSNLLLTAVQQMSGKQVRLDSWWQGSTFTNFNFETGAKASLPTSFGAPQMTYTEGSSAPETVVTTPYTANDYETVGIQDWTVPLDSRTWTKHVVTKA